MFDNAMQDARCLAVYEGDLHARVVGLRSAGLVLMTNNL